MVVRLVMESRRSMMQDDGHGMQDVIIVVMMMCMCGLLVPDECSGGNPEG